MRLVFHRIIEKNSNFVSHYPCGTRAGPSRPHSVASVPSLVDAESVHSISTMSNLSMYLQTDLGANVSN